MTAATLPQIAGVICEKCWTDAGVMAATSGRSQGREYWSLLRLRRTNPCTEEQRTGIPVVDEPVFAPTELSASACRMLDFERQWWQVRGHKDRAILTAFSLKSVEYYRRLNRLVEDPSALAYAPDVVRRLTKLRSAKAWRMT